MIKDDTCTEIFWNCIPNKVQSSSLTPTNIDQQTWFIFIYCLNLLLPIFFKIYASIEKKVSKEDFKQ